MGGGSDGEICGPQLVFLLFVLGFLFLDGCLYLNFKKTGYWIDQIAHHRLLRPIKQENLHAAG